MGQKIVEEEIHRHGAPSGHHLSDQKTERPEVDEKPQNGEMDQHPNAAHLCAVKINVVARFGRIIRDWVGFYK